MNRRGSWSPISNSSSNNNRSNHQGGSTSIMMSNHSGRRGETTTTSNSSMSHNKSRSPTSPNRRMVRRFSNSPTGGNARRARRRPSNPHFLPADSILGGTTMTSSRDAIHNNSGSGSVVKRQHLPLARSKSDGPLALKRDGNSTLKHLVDYSRTRATHHVDGVNRSSCHGPVMSRHLYVPEQQTSNSSSHHNTTSSDGRRRRAVMPNRRRSMGTDAIDWNILTSTMDLSNEDHSSSNHNYLMGGSMDGGGCRRQRNELDDKQPPQFSLERPDPISRTCSAQLRLKLAKSASMRMKMHDMSNQDNSNNNNNNIDTSNPERPETQQDDDDGVVWILQDNHNEVAEEVDPDALTPRRRITRSRSIDTTTMFHPAILRYRRKPTVPLTMDDPKIDDES